MIVILSNSAISPDTLTLTHYDSSSSTKPRIPKARRLALGLANCPSRCHTQECPQILESARSLLRCRANHHRRDRTIQANSRLLACQRQGEFIFPLDGQGLTAHVANPLTVTSAKVITPTSGRTGPFVHERKSHVYTPLVRLDVDQKLSLCTANMVFFDVFVAISP
jgi:hypothetical protein